MPMTPDGAALARRIAESLSPRTLPVDERKELPVAEPMTTDSAAVAYRDDSSPAAPVSIAPSIADKRIVPPKATAPTVMAPKAAARPTATETPSGHFEVLSDAITSAQDIVRETACQMADTRLNAASALISLQQRLLEIVHANMSASFAVAQKIVSTPNVGEAIAAHRSFAQEQILALTHQAAELRRLSTKLAQETQEPWTAFWAGTRARPSKGHRD